MRDFFGIKIIFKIGIETFDNDFRNNILNKNADFDSYHEVKDYFDSVCLMVGIEGQTRDSIKKDIDILINNFQYGTINVYTNNSTDIKKDVELIQWFKDCFGYLEKFSNIDILYENTDFGVG